MKLSDETTKLVEKAQKLLPILKEAYQAANSAAIDHSHAVMVAEGSTNASPEEVAAYAAKVPMYLERWRTATAVHTKVYDDWLTANDYALSAISDDTDISITPCHRYEPDYSGWKRKAAEVQIQEEEETEFP